MDIFHLDTAKIKNYTSYLAIAFKPIADIASKENF